MINADVQYQKNLGNEKKKKNAVEFLVRDFIKLGPYSTQS